MKKVKFLLFIFSVLLFSNSLFAYGRTVPLSARVQNAEIVFEGKIIKKESFWNDSHSSIFTKNTIKVSRTFKGISTETIEVISQGGIVGNDFEFISHATSFELEAEGVFFCKTFKTKSNDDFLMINGMSGFIIYNNQENEVYTNYKYFTRKQLIYDLSKLVDSREKNPEDVTGVEYSIQNVSLLGNILNFDIYVEGLWGSYDFAEAELFIEYDPSVLGLNIGSSGVLTLSPGVVSSSSNYSLSVNDVNPDKVSIDIKALNTGLALHTITNVAEQLVHIQIVSPTSGNPDIEFDETAMQQLSSYLDANNGVEAFQQVFAIGSISDVGGISLVPQIMSFSPDTVRAGTGDILTIIGTDFGATKGQVKFPNADDGGATYTQTPVGDILTWTPTMITVRVPSQFNGAKPAGTGQFLVETSSGAIANSNTVLEVLFAMYNFQTSINTSNLIFLADDEDGDGMEDGTLGFQVDNTINNNPNAISIVERALCDWNNITNIKWKIDTVSNKNTSADFDSVNLIYFADVSEFIGSSAEATAYTKISGSRIENCQSPGNPINPVPYLREVDIVIREDLTTIPNNPINGGYSFDINNLLPNQMDFYSVVIHELGHVHLLRHAIDDNKLMYWQLPAGTSRQGLSYSEFKGGEFVLAKSDTIVNLGFCPQTISKENICEPNSTNSFLAETSISIYPNPFINQINIHFETVDNIDKLNISLVNIIGQTIKQKNYNILQKGEQNIIVSDLENVPNGIYFLVMKIDDISVVHKILKQ